MVSKLKIGFAALVIGATVWTCQSPDLYTFFYETPSGWANQTAINFKYKNVKPLSSDVFIVIRTTPTYEFSNLFVIAKLTTPSGVVQVDTLEYEMSFPDGRQMGGGLTAVKTHKLWYKESYDFNEIGVYSFDVEHAMRRAKEIDAVAKLQGITDVGLQIVKPSTE